MSWRRATPLLLDGLAWGVPPERLLDSVATSLKAVEVRAVHQDLVAGRPLAEALKARGAPSEVVEAARLGDRLNAQAAVGLRSRAAAAGTLSDRVELLGGLALPLVTLSTIASAAIGFGWELEPGIGLAPPMWVLWTARILSLGGLVLAAGLAVPAVGRLLIRLPGLGWIGRRRRAARLADLLAITLRAGGDPRATLQRLGAARCARALDSGVPLPEALRRHPDGRRLAAALSGLGPASWPTALSDCAARLAAEAADRSATWATGIRIGGTMIAAGLATVWLLWIYGGLGGLPSQLGGP